ncbi:MAG TPA: hypothetical protein PLG15_05830 [Candidatus Gastranaerophilaceae bacterium]|nr:hypothetical protein [Candidatus Gastranaerophilaceae bacterium]HPT41885.1 hypothetical protein [Candidatus Gastranaerophilaceae bacterium]
MNNLCVDNFSPVSKVNFCGTTIPQYKPLKPLSQDTFERTTSKKEISFEGWPKIFSEVGAVTTEAVAKLSKAEMQHLTGVAKSKIDEQLVDDITRFSQILKKGLDAKFNKKYVFVSIGQSPAAFADVLNATGVETAICPISNLSNLKNASPLLRNPNLSKYFEYMKKIGLDPNKMKNSGKQYIFVDISSTGKSLKIFEEFLRDKKSGFNLPNVKFVSLQDLMSSCKPSNSEEASFMEEFFEEYIKTPELKKEFSSIFKLDYKDIDKVQQYRDKTPANEKLNMLKLLVLNKVLGR